MTLAIPKQLSSSATRIYYYFVLGAVGGLTGWYVTALWSRSAGSSPTLGYLIVQGAMLGSLIGLGAGCFDGIASRSPARILKFGGTSLLLGLAAGAMALPVVQVLYSVVHPANAGHKLTALSFFTGTICWILFGGLIGLGEGFSKGSQSWKGMVGGMIGGALGGGVYEAIGRPVAASASPSAQAVLAIALITLGGFIGSAVALVALVLKEAWLTIENGKLAGTEINISKYVHKELGSRRPGVIGSSQWDSNIYLPGDANVLPKHASIGYVNGAPTLTALPSARQRRAITRLNGRPITEFPLSNGDRLEIGSTTLTYRHKQ